MKVIKKIISLMLGAKEEDNNMEEVMVEEELPINKIM